ncbi:hypothetical protein NL676_014453 [Syzygium grande]|nr:hypothetical protein NL676_014453 [Syzygium grande]
MQNLTHPTVNQKKHQSRAARDLEDTALHGDVPKDSRQEQGKKGPKRHDEGGREPISQITPFASPFRSDFFSPLAFAVSPRAFPGRVLPRERTGEHRFLSPSPFPPGVTRETQKEGKAGGVGVFLPLVLVLMPLVSGALEI